MNPNDSSEFQILLNKIKNDLPIFNKKTVTMKAINGQLPKSMQAHATKLNEKFLDHNGDIIDEINHRNKNNIFIESFNN